MADKRLFKVKILKRQWVVYDSVEVYTKEESYGECAYGPTGVGTIRIYSGMEDAGRLNTLCHECFHAAFDHMVEAYAEEYGNSVAGYLQWKQITRQPSRKVANMRKTLSEHSNSALAYLAPSYRLWFARDLANVLKLDGWSLP